MKRISVIAFLILLCAVLCISSVSCKKKTEEPSSSAKKMNISLLSDGELASYVALGEYKGLSIELGTRTKDAAVWEEIAARAEVKQLPEQQVSYYFAQAKAQYEYYAERADMSYEDMLSELGTSEDKMLSEAKDLALGDILFELVRRAEGIELTALEKQEHFDRYADKYVEDYGYTAEYVRENLTEQIYSSMLYDKLTEFLISNNDIH